MRRLVLASASPARLRLLRAAGFDPEVLPSEVDEHVASNLATAEAVVLLARRKAEVVARVLDDALVLGADSLLDLDGEALGKPGTPELATQRWQRLGGAKATLCTGQCLIDTATGKSAEALTTTRITFARPSASEIAAYVSSGEPLQVAGAFTIDGRGGAFVEHLEGDANAVVGLSIARLRLQLAELGIAITELWRNEQ